MIIECINCNKKFNVESNLIPDIGRKIQCGSCKYTWHYKIERPLSKTFILNKESDQKEKVLEKNKIEEFKKEIINSKEKSVSENSDKKTEFERKEEPKKVVKSSNLGNFFSFLIVFIISILALIILVDTLKSPLIQIFPGLEIILFNLFETLKDVKLFIIDLT